MKIFILIRNLDIRTLVNDKELEREMVEQSKELYEQKTLPGLYFSQNMGNMYTPSLYYSLFAFLIRLIFNSNQ
jgi:3-hydroxy-3-methylglutaryl CoA synthase